MRVSIEWFILDNWAMDAAIVILAGALSGLRPRWVMGSIACLFCALYALFAVWLCPLLLKLPFRLLAGAVLALGLRFKGWSGYARAVFSVYICAFVLGGLMTALSPLGAYANGMIIGTLKSRIVLLCAPAIALTPRVFRRLRSMSRHESKLVRVRLTFGEGKKELTALIDTGNLLHEPISGIPVMLVEDWPCSDGLPVPYESAMGRGELKANRAKLCELYVDGAWQAVDIMVAPSPVPIRGADAVFPHAAMPPSKKSIKEEVSGVADHSLF